MIPLRSPLRIGPAGTRGFNPISFWVTLLCSVSLRLRFLHCYRPARRRRRSRRRHEQLAQPVIARTMASAIAAGTRRFRNMGWRRIGELPGSIGDCGRRNGELIAEWPRPACVRADSHSRSGSFLASSPTGLHGISPASSRAVTFSLDRSDRHHRIHPASCRSGAFPNR